MCTYLEIFARFASSIQCYRAVLALQGVFVFVQDVLCFSCRSVLFSWYRILVFLCKCTSLFVIPMFLTVSIAPCNERRDTYLPCNCVHLVPAREFERWERNCGRVV